MTNFLAQCRDAIGAQHVLTEDADIVGYVRDWRGRFSGKALAVVKPGNTEEVATVVRICRNFRIPIVPQGGNTGLVLGSVPDESGTAIVLSLTRLAAIRTIDLLNNTITVEAGCILSHIQQAAFQANRLFPLSLASEDSCTIGGNLSTNAGGTAVLRYGNARELCLGLEVVTAEGEIWNGLRALRKDNTGYDLRDLFIGAEGTLGIITAAVLKLFPQPAAQVTAFAAMQTHHDALEFLKLMQSQCGTLLTGFEFMSDDCLQLVTHHFPSSRSPFSRPYPHYVLIDISDNESTDHANSLLEKAFSKAMQQNIIQDAVIAQSHAQSQGLWFLREQISAAQAIEGKNIKHDIAVPISAIGDFVRITASLLQASFPHSRLIVFGHLGDGNLHFNVSPPKNISDEEFIAHQLEINRIVHDSVHNFGGTISAEHGLGALKNHEIIRYKSAVEIKMMQMVKHSFDPFDLMNPGKGISLQH
jgi:FAD/FMN-containing dehydrogenase